MKQNIADILKEALKLPPEARAALAGTLLDSLDDTVDQRGTWGHPIFFLSREKSKKK